MRSVEHGLRTILCFACPAGVYRVVKGFWEARSDWVAVIEHMHGYIYISKSLSDGRSTDGKGEGR